MDWPGPYRQDTASFLSLVRERADGRAAVYLERHVASLLEGDCQEGESCVARFGSLPHHATHEQGHRPGASGRGQAAKGGRLRADPQAQPLAAVEASGESLRPSGGEAGGAFAIQPEVDPQPLDEGGLSAFLGILESWLGGQVLGPVVYSRDAQQDRPHEENGRNAS